MMTPEEKREFDQLKKDVEQLKKSRLFDPIPGSLRQRHLEAWIIFSGVVADLPDGTTEVKAYFATDTNTLYLWNGTAWVGEVLT